MFANIHVKDFLSFSEEFELKIIAGKSGLTKVIANVGIHDYENTYEIRKSFMPGDVVLTTLHMCRKIGRAHV